MAGGASVGGCEVYDGVKDKNSVSYCGKSDGLKAF